MVEDSEEWEAGMRAEDQARKGEKVRRCGMSSKVVGEEGRMVLTGQKKILFIHSGDVIEGEE